MLGLPNLLSLVRLALVPVLLLLAWNGQSKLFLLCLVLVLATDVSDGLLARSLHQTTELGAKLDSWADLFSYLSIPLCAWWLRPDVIRQESVLIGSAIFLYLAAVVVGFLKFRHLTSYHTWGAKVSAVLLGVAVLWLFAGGPGWVLRWVMPVIILAELEEIAITAILPKPTTNVPSLWHAVKLQRSEQIRGAGAERTHA